MDRDHRRARVAFVLVSVPLAVACGFGPSARYAAVSTANLVPLVVLVLQLRGRTGADRVGRVFMAAGTAVLLAHNVQNQVAIAGSGRPAAGAIAAASLALGYALLVAGGAVAAARFAGSDHGGIVDAAVIGLAVANLLWGLLLYPAHVRLGSSPGTLAYEMSLVLLVTALAGVVLRLAVVVRKVRTAALYLLLAIGTSTAADVTFTFTEDPVSHLAVWWASALCVVALTAFGAAFLHPSSSASVDAAPSTPRLTLWRLAFLGAALATTPILVVCLQLTGGPFDAALIGVGQLLMVPLVLSRIGQLARRHAEAERRLRKLAAHDELTGLPNRRTMVQHLHGLLARSAEGSSRGVVVLYIDLDDFKAVNDTHGHVVGDQLLRVVAARIRGSVRPGDLVARFGGDEFVAILEGDHATGVEVAARVEAALAGPVTIGAIRVSGRASIGIAAAAPDVPVDAERLLDLADAEMYCAKRRRPDPFAPTTTLGPTRLD